jgi:acylphosphatase
MSELPRVDEIVEAIAKDYGNEGFVPNLKDKAVLVLLNAFNELQALCESDSDERQAYVLVTRTKDYLRAVGLTKKEET